MTAYGSLWICSQEMSFISQVSSYTSIRTAWQHTQAITIAVFSWMFLLLLKSQSSSLYKCLTQEYKIFQVRISEALCWLVGIFAIAFNLVMEINPNVNTTQQLKSFNSLSRIHLLSSLEAGSNKVSSSEITRYKSYPSSDDKGSLSLWIVFQWDTFLRVEKGQLETDSMCILWIVYLLNLHQCSPWYENLIEAFFLRVEDYEKSIGSRSNIQSQSVPTWWTLCQLICCHLPGFLRRF